jgi:hypothetical protein
MSTGVASRRHFLRVTGIAAGAERIVSVITNNGHFPGPLLRFKEGQPVADRGGYAGSVSVFVPRVDRAEVSSVAGRASPGGVRVQRAAVCLEGPSVLRRSHPSQLSAGLRSEQLESPKSRGREKTGRPRPPA